MLAQIANFSFKRFGKLGVFQRNSLDEPKSTVTRITTCSAVEAFRVDPVLGRSCLGKLMKEHLLTVVMSLLVYAVPCLFQFLKVYGKCLFHRRANLYAPACEMKLNTILHQEWHSSNTN